MNFDNGYRPRPGQHNNKRGRSRNRRPGGGGSGSSSNSGSGNAPNRVYESNGPDVKVRGTAQTVAEKYQQLGRDAQSAGDNVMAESYYQHAEHYYRIWASNQPAGQTLQAFRKPGDEGFEEEVEDNGDGDNEHGANDAEGNAEGGDAAPEQTADGGEPATQQQRPFRQRDNREPRENTRDNNRDGNRERFKPRWQNRRDGTPDERNNDAPAVASEASEASVEPVNQPRPTELASDMAADNDQWEAPSFLTRPVPTPVAAEPEADVSDAPAVERRPRARKPKPLVVQEAEAEESQSPEAPTDND